MRRAALRGGAYLLGRHAVSIALDLGGVLLITRVLGPARYGAYVAALAVYGYATLVGQSGVNVFLLRGRAEVGERAYGTASTVLLAVSLCLALLLELGAGVVAQTVGVPACAPTLRLMAPALLFQLMAVPAVSRLERALDYRSVAVLENLGQIVFYAVATPLVLLGGGPTALALSWLLQQAASALAAHVAARVPPRFAFDRAVAAAMLRYAGCYSLANWIWQIRLLVAPLVVGPALGAAAVGLIGLAVGLLEVLCVLRVVVSRMAVAVMAKIQTDVEALRVAMTEGMELQTLALGAILVGFGWNGWLVIPRFFGTRWVGVMEVYPYLALAYFTQATFTMHLSALALFRRNGRLALFNLSHVALFAGAAAVLVPRCGLVGYGYAEAVALPSYLLAHALLAPNMGRPHYLPTAFWWLGVAIGLFWRDLGVWAVAAPFAALLVPPSPRRLLHFAGKARRR